MQGLDYEAFILGFLNHILVNNLVLSLFFEDFHKYTIPIESIRSYCI